MKKSVWFHIVLLATLLAPTMRGASDASVIVTLPTFNDPGLQKEFTGYLLQKQYLPAAKLLLTLLSEHASELMSDNDTLISTDAWVDASIDFLPADQQSALHGAFDQQFHDAAAAQLRKLATDSSGNRDALYSLARRWRFCLPGAEAYAEVADIALDRGDLESSRSLYQLAQQHNWNPDEPHRAKLNALHGLAPASGPTLVPVASASFGKAVPSAIFFPVQDNAYIYIGGPTGAFALQSDGRPVWSDIAKTPPKSPPAGGLWLPALFTDVQGHGQILVTRQLDPHALPHQELCRLMARRATDGKVIWSTDSEPFLADLNFIGVPTICGGFTYCLATATSLSHRSEFMAIAIDTLTGHLRWQERIAWLPALNSVPTPNAELATDTDALFIATNIGLTACLDRFNGQIRWLRRYGGAASKRTRGTLQIQNDVLITAPTDSLQIFALGKQSGQPIWSIPDADSVLLDHAIVANESSVTALNPKTGQGSWRWKSRTDITGLASVQNNQVLIPAESGMIILDSTTGKPLAPTTSSPLQTLLENPETRKLFRDLGADKFFAAPTTHPTTEP